jgi:hypothetical protein
MKGQFHGGIEMTRAVKIDCPKHVKLASQVFHDRIEFEGINTISGQKIVKPFFFKEDEPTFVSDLKKLTIVDQLVKEVQ